MNTIIPRILVVDDEPDLELLITQKFRKEIKNGLYSFVFASNGVEALAKLNADKEIELVLTDINMPEMDGLTLLTKIKELNNPLLLSVIVSAYGDIINIRTAMNAGAFDFVVKPIDLSDLEITIRKSLDNLSALKKAMKARDELISVRNELEEARALQLSMLPKSIPELKGLEIAAYMNTASEVGGDYYDFSFHEDNSINIAIGDATGHGMRAGIMVAVMKTLFVTNSTHHDIQDFFAISNKAIKTLNLGRMMMAFLMLNIKGNQVKFISAGMPSIYIYKKADRKIVEHDAHSMPLGAIASQSFAVNTFTVETGDVILILSDGLPELLNNRNQFFSYERLSSEFLSVAEESPNNIIESLRIKSVEWANGTDPVDDITFIAIKIN